MLIIDVMSLRTALLATCTGENPSVFQSPANAEAELIAVKYRVPPTSVRKLTWLLPVPGKMSVKRRVPTLVPSVRHSSSPWAAVVAQKYMKLPLTVPPPQLESAEPGLMSFTSETLVPSVRHSSLPTP